VGTTEYYVVTAISDESGEESLASGEAGSTNATSALTWNPADGCTNYSVYKRKNGVYGFIGAAAKVLGSTTVTFTDATIVPDTSTTPPLQKQPVRRRHLQERHHHGGGHRLRRPDRAAGRTTASLSRRSS
jgi:hypothetical protein